MPPSSSVQTSSTIIPSRLSALHPANHRFFTPLFSSTSEPLFPQLLCFHIYLRCPLVFLSVYSVPARPAGGPPTSAPSVFRSFPEVLCREWLAASCSLLPLFFAPPSF